MRRQLCLLLAAVAVIAGGAVVEAAAPVGAAPRLASVEGMKDVGGRQAIVEVLFEVADGADVAEAGRRALALVGAPEMRAADEIVRAFVLNASFWSQFYDYPRSNDSVVQYYNPAGDPTGGGGLQALQSSQATWSDVQTSSFRLELGVSRPTPVDVLRWIQPAQRGRLAGRLRRSGRVGRRRAATSAAAAHRAAFRVPHPRVGDLGLRDPVAPADRSRRGAEHHEELGDRRREPLRRRDCLPARERACRRPRSLSRSGRDHVPQLQRRAAVAGEDDVDGISTLYPLHVRPQPREGPFTVLSRVGDPAPGGRFLDIEFEIGDLNA